MPVHATDTILPHPNRAPILSVPSWIVLDLWASQTDHDGHQDEAQHTSTLLQYTQQASTADCTLQNETKAHVADETMFSLVQQYFM